MRVWIIMQEWVPAEGCPSGPVIRYVKLVFYEKEIEADGKATIIFNVVI